MIMGNELLTGEKVRLAGITKDDLPLFTTWFSSLDLVHMVRDTAALPATLQDEEAWFERQRKRDDYQFAIRTAADGTLIGSCGLMEIQWQARHALLGIAVGDPSYWGRGYGSDAVRVLLRYAFMELNLNRVALEVYAYNARAIAAYRKVGFNEEGRLRQALYRDGSYHDIVAMAVLRREWAGMTRS
jgi:RimJ/RimL family protein N-acetyltransferase